MAVQFVTPDRPETDGLTKTDLVGDLIAVELKEYRTDAPTSYGPSERADLTLFVIGGDHAGTVQPDTAFFGNLAKQIAAIGVGNFGVGRITTGKSANGRDWYGFDHSADAEDHAAAGKAVEAALKAGSATASTPASSDAPF